MGSDHCCKKRYDTHFTSAETIKELLDLMLAELKTVDSEIKILEKNNANSKGNSKSNSGSLNEKERFYKIFYVGVDDCVYKLSSKSFFRLSELKELVSSAFNTLDTLDEKDLKNTLIKIDEFIKENENKNLVI